MDSSGGEGPRESWWGGFPKGLEVCSRNALVEVGSILPVSGRLWVARLDGMKMADPDHAFYEFSDSLLFPAYFGGNWDALSDCLRDLSWLAADGYLILVENVSQLLSGNLGDRRILFQILSRAVRHWASYLGDAPAGLKVLLLCDDEEQVRLLKHEIAA
ncbi:barstar family protein [Actinoplanes sp. NPDC023801]|uniref:barstar family protein n=1 Tax=Actinoplanes sp. NPDC023801 TaxID=3154595 RepID=UPI0033D0ACC9